MQLLPAFTGVPETNQVYNVNAETMLTSLPDDYIDLIVTSPPYDNLRTYNGFSWDFEYIAHQSYRVLKTGGVLVWVVGDSVVNGSETLNCFKQAIYFKEQADFRVHDTMIWRTETVVFPENSRYAQQFEYMFVLSKGAPKSKNLIQKANKYAGDTRPNTTTSTNWKADGSKTTRLGKHVNDTSPLGNVWLIDTGYLRTTKDVEAYEHPAIFPEALAERHILTWSNPGDVVLDYFGGSGTTAKMARKNGRDYITCDISLEYCQLMQKRLDMPFTPMFAEMLTA